MQDAIHFLNTGHSDCIIIESGGRFAMVDAAEDNDYPANKPMLKLQGYEEEVCKYLVDNCADENGVVTLDFILGTHAHSDHIGGFDTVINHPQIKVKKAFLKKYVEKDINYFERSQWDNTEVYMQMYNALKNKNVDIVEEFDGCSFKFGNFNITFFNGTHERHYRKCGENVNSVVTLVEKNGLRALLAGDFNTKFLSEKKLAPKIGKVNLLKVAHHCYAGSSSKGWIKTLNPDIAVITNSLKKADSRVLARIKKYASPEVYTTVDCNGVKAVFGDTDIEMIKNIM